MVTRRKENTICIYRVVPSCNRIFELVNITTTDFTYDWRNLLVEDVNSDGISDIIISRTFLSVVQILLGRSDGMFDNPIAVNFSRDIADRKIAIGDFNEDHILDVAVSNFYGNYIEIWRGFGRQIYTRWAFYYMGAGNMPDSLVVGDLNEDNHLDLIAVLGANNSIIVLIGTGSGFFTRSSRLSLGLNGFISSPVMADFNNDNHLDIAVINTWNHKVIIAFGFGNGTFGQIEQFYTGFASFPFSISVNDLNSDGMTDFVVINRGSANVLIFYGIGDASFHRVELQSEYLVDVGLLVVADFNGDHRQDILVANMVGNKTVMFLADGNNLYEYKPICLQLPYVYSRMLAVRYMNMNEPPDIIIAAIAEVFLIRNRPDYWTV